MSRLRWTTAGESHGKALVGILEGMPAGLAIDLARVDAELARRQSGYGRGGRMKIERDRVDLLSGTRAGLTLGSPIALSIVNQDASIEKLPVPTNPRPGHADLAGCQKFGHRDPRAVLERASARETATRVALASVARQVLEHFGIEVFAHVVELGGIAIDRHALDSIFARGCEERRRARDASEFMALDPAIEARWRAEVDRAKEDGDTLGGVFEVQALGLPPGLGSYVSGPERLTALVGGALFSIPAIKGVEFGIGFECARLRGSNVHDAIVGAREGDASGEVDAQPGEQQSSGGDTASNGRGEMLRIGRGETTSTGRYRRATNRAGGLEGGMTTGEPLVVHAAMKPIPTLRRGLPSVEFATLEPVAATYQRSDVTSVPAASVVGEAMVALELARAFLAKFGGDSLDQIEAQWRHFREVLTRV
jgi:chorismate synthase